MKQIIFFSETALNGKYQMVANFELPVEGIKKYGSTFIHIHKGEIHKNLNNYWVDKNTLESMKKQFNMERTSF